MTVPKVADDASTIHMGPRTLRQLRSNWRGDVLVVGSFALIALWVTSGLWLHPSHVTFMNGGDESQNEWFLEHGVRVWKGLEGPFHSNQIGVPNGINVLANASVLGLSVPLAPLTMLVGPRAVFTLLTFLGLALTPTGWYFLLSRRLAHRWAGWAGAMIAGLSPGMLTSANSCLNLVCQFLVPLLVWRALKMAEPGRAMRNAAWLAAVAVWQFFIASEVLMLTALAVGSFMAVLCVIDPTWRVRWRYVLAAGSVAAVAALAAAAYPIWYEFHGPGSYLSLPPSWKFIAANPFSYLFFARMSLFGSAREADGWAPNPVQEHALLGITLVFAASAAALLMRRNRTVVALAVLGIVAAVCSLGPRFSAAGKTVPLPWELADHLPVLSAMVPVRWGFVVADVCGVLIATAVRAYGTAPTAGRRFVAIALTALAIVPNLPKALPTAPVPGPPPFLHSAALARFSANGGSLLFAPPTTWNNPLGAFWTAETGSNYNLVQGYFFSPGPDGVALTSPALRPLSLWLIRVSQGEPASPPSTKQALADLRYWHTTAIVLEPVAVPGDGTPPQDGPEMLARMRQEITALLGVAPETVDGVELWDVRGLTPVP